MANKRMQLCKIDTTHNTQARAAIDADTVTDYAEAMQAGAEFPPVVLFNDGSAYFLADGFHRVLAATRAGLPDVLADVRKGTKQDALWFAVGANRTNGKRLTRADVRHAIQIVLADLPDRSNNAIAKQIGCSDHTVADVRAELESTSQIARLTKRTGADGKTRPAHAPEASGKTEQDDPPCAKCQHPLSEHSFGGECQHLITPGKKESQCACMRFGRPSASIKPDPEPDQDDPTPAPVSGKNWVYFEEDAEAIREACERLEALTLPTANLTKAVVILSKLAKRLNSLSDKLAK